MHVTACCTPISVRRELLKDGGGSGCGVARRARAARAPKAKSTAHLRHVLWCFLRNSLRHVLRPSRAPPSRVAQGQRGGRHACVRRGFRRWKMTRATASTFTLPSSAAPSTSSATSCFTSWTTQAVGQQHTRRPPPRPALRPSRAFSSCLAQGQARGRHVCVG